MTDVQAKAAIFERLKHSLQALSIQASDQAQLFPDFVVKTDELVLDFDHWLAVILDNYRNELSAEQMESLTAVDARVDAASASGDKSLWSEEALGSHPFWADLRSLAIESLRAFGWPQERPPSYPHEYVRGSRADS